MSLTQKYVTFFAASWCVFNLLYNPSNRFLRILFPITTTTTLRIFNQLFVLKRHNNINNNKHTSRHNSICGRTQKCFLYNNNIPKQLGDAIADLFSATCDTRVQIHPGGHGRQALRALPTLAQIHPEYAEQAHVRYFVYWRGNRYGHRHQRSVVLWCRRK